MKYTSMFKLALSRLQKLSHEDSVLALTAAFCAKNYELALVGGPVRDCFLDRPVVDLDFATNATPQETLRLVKPISSGCWTTGARYGTVSARVKGRVVEITTYRSDNYSANTRKPKVSFGGSLEEDLIRRDFTVNAMAFRVPSGQLVDISSGLQDIANKRLATPIKPELSFADDPLRMLRAARLSSQLGFKISENSLLAMKDCAKRLKIVSAERVRGEFEKLLCCADPTGSLRVLVNTGLINHFLPEISALRLEIDEHFHHKDVYEHSLIVLRQAIKLEQERFRNGPDLVLRLAALMHDIGKPATRRKHPDGSVTFYHHDTVGAKMASKRLAAMRFDKNVIFAVTRLIQLHLRFFGYGDQSWTDSAVRRYVRDAGPQLERLHILTRADVTTRNQNKARRLRAAYDNLEERIAKLRAQEELDAIRPELNGEEIMSLLDLKPGKEVGVAYKYLLDLRLDNGPIGKQESARKLLLWWKSERR